MQARFKRKEAGQSIPVIALILVVLFGMVGLSVDVGNTYAEQRGLVRATNAAALAGMNALLANGDDQGIASTIRASLESNGIKVAVTADGVAQAGERRVEAYYLGPSGNEISSCRIGSCGTVPIGVSFIRVTTNGLVDTYFARVVGRNTLPVNANAWSAQCLPINGVYPIAIKNSYLNANGFVNSDGTYSELDNRNKTTRHLFLRDDGNAPDGFNFLAWTAANYGNTSLMEKALDDAGTLNDGFKEVNPWPDPSTTAPANYPLAPEQMSLGDWIHGNSGLDWSKLAPKLNALAANKTAVILPIVDTYVGNDATAAYHLARLGRFYILDVGVKGGTNYINLVYLGPSDGTACLQTNVEPIAPSTPPLSVKGSVWVNPRWNIQNNNNPVSYQIVLDVSGSMSLDYYGLGTLGGNRQVKVDSTGGDDYWCDNWYNPHVPARNYDYKQNFSCGAGGNGAVWRNYQERRVYVAKNAIKRLIDGMGQYDVMRLVTFTNKVNVSYAQVYPSSGWAGDKPGDHDLLKTEVENGGTFANDPYRTQGGTPGADALSKTASVLADSSKPKMAGDGRPFKNVVIYLTDGMSNIFKGGKTNENKGDDICTDIFPVDKRFSLAECQTGVRPDGVYRPITQMVDEASKMKKADSSLVIYTIGLADVNPVGLPQVASSPSGFKASNDPAGLDDILLEIQANINNPCIEAGASGADYKDTIPAGNVATFSGQYAPPVDGYGYVYLYDQNHQPLPGNLARVPIVPDPLNGKLSWSLPEGAGLTPGTYIAEAFVGYKGQDQVPRVYSTISDHPNISNEKSTSMSFEVSYSNVLGNQLVIKPMYLDLTGDVCAKS